MRGDPNPAGRIDPGRDGMTTLRTFFPCSSWRRFPRSSRAGYDLWTAEGGPFGGRIATLHVRTGTGEIFAGTEGGGVFRRDAGAWIARSNGLFPLDAVAFATNPLHPDTMFAGTGGGGRPPQRKRGRQLVSREQRPRKPHGPRSPLPGGGRPALRGDGWGRHLLHRRRRAQLVSIQRRAHRPLRPLSRGRPLESRHVVRGDRCRCLPLPGRGSELGARARRAWRIRSSRLWRSTRETATVVYAATEGGGVYRTLDGGLSWAAAPDRDGGRLRGGPVDPGRPPGHDLGRHTERRLRILRRGRGPGWRGRPASRTRWPPPFSRGTIRFMSERYWGGVFRAATPASGWSSWNEGLAGRFVWELAVSPHDPGVVWAASYGGVSVTTDTGWTWSDAPAGITKYDARTVAVSPTDPNRILAGFFYGGVFRSTSGGSAWVPSSSGLPANATVTAPPVPAGQRESRVVRYLLRPVPEPERRGLLGGLLERNRLEEDLGSRDGRDRALPRLRGNVRRRPLPLARLRRDMGLGPSPRAVCEGHRGRPFGHVDRLRRGLLHGGRVGRGVQVRDGRARPGHGRTTGSGARVSGV